MTEEECQESSSFIVQPFPLSYTRLDWVLSRFSFYRENSRSKQCTPFSLIIKRVFSADEFSASRCAEQLCPTHRETAIGACDMSRAARYLLIGEVPEPPCMNLCARGDFGA